MRAKLIDGALVYAPRKIQTEIDGESYITYNPTDEQLAAQNWLPVVYTEPPDDPPEGSHYESSFSEEEDQIIQEWTLVEDPPEPDPDEEEIDAAEALGIILGGDPDET